MGSPAILSAVRESIAREVGFVSKKGGEKAAMKMLEVRQKARAMGVAPRRMRKAELIRAIQEAEGNEPCFGRANGHCAHSNCCWWDDCMGK
jgi:hypothetical protein